MPTSPIYIRDTGDLKRLNKALRQVADGKELRKELTSGLRDELRPVVNAVKAAYGGGEHLRPALQKATRSEVRTTGRLAGARVRVDGRKMPEGMRSLPRYREGYKPRWRHPVFGNRDVWVDQPAQPVFDRTVAPFEALLRARLQEIVGRVIAKAARYR